MSTEPIVHADPANKVIQMVDKILLQAIQKKASDIHIESDAVRMRVRFRMDGSLSDIMEIPLVLKEQVISRIKIMSQLNIGERRIPQDGRLRFQAKFENQTIDGNFRVNTMPTVFGESAVLRVIRHDNLNLNLKAIGFTPYQYDIFKKSISAPNGLVLVTGPTGSGKTSTLYSALAELNSPDEKLVTVEDPVEYHLDGVTQVQIHKEAGLTFASVVKALLRQDPDVILVGEIRDQETAEITIQSALTGHLVLSTMHTNDAPSAVVRLMNMKIESFLVVASLAAVVAQRLIRRICPDCKIPIKISRTQLARVDLDRDMLKGATFYKGKGCEKCSNTGYKGRVAIFEVMDFNDDLKEAVLKNPNTADLRKLAISTGMVTLRQSALSVVIAGQTTLTEALATT